MPTDSFRVLVTGGQGQLGSELGRIHADPPLQLAVLTRGEFDITDEASSRDGLRRHRPALVVNTAAYTAVDAAETDVDTWRVNRDGVAHLARACSHNGIPLVHVSTDYVFNGARAEPYREQDLTDPQSEYGRSKLAGEQVLRESLKRHVILRTSWVFAGRGRNFVGTILRLARERPEIRVVADQRGCPTPAASLARTIVTIARRIQREGEVPWGTYHYCGAPATTWHGFAQAIVAVARRSEPLALREIVPITTSEFPTAAQRPLNSVLDCTLIERTFGIERPRWHDALAEVIAELRG